MTYTQLLKSIARVIEAGHGDDDVILRIGEKTSGEGFMEGEAYVVKAEHSGLCGEYIDYIIAAHA